MGRPPEMEGSRLRQNLFIKRERVRRAMIKTRPGETICLQYEEVALLLKWIKELEESVKTQEGRNKKYGIKEV